MKQLIQIISVLFITVVSMTRSDAQTVTVEQFETKINFELSSLDSSGLNHNITYTNKQSAGKLPHKSMTPAQVVFAHIDNTNQQASMVVLGNKSEQTVSPAWLYVMMIVVLLGVLFWNDDQQSL